MFIPNFFDALTWYSLLLFVGLLFFPISNYFFSSFFDRGFAFSKVVGMILISYSMYVLGTLHLLPFTQISLVFILLFWGGLSVYLFFTHTLKVEKKERRRLLWIVLLEEILFLLCFFSWLYVRSFSPDIHSLEKYMDFGFMNSILKSTYFPPKDMWFAPYAINYYYFGHLVTAVLTKLSHLSSGLTYNFMLSSIVGFCFTMVFSLATTLFFRLPKIQLKYVLFTGLLAALLTTFGGNLHTLYAFFKPYNTEKPEFFFSIKKEEAWKFASLEFSLFNPCFNSSSYYDSASKTKIICSETEQAQRFSYPNAYWYPNATRFIYNTIHEFPIYSWVVADLHGHVLDIPFVLFVIALLLAFFTHTASLPLLSFSSLRSSIKKDLFYLVTLGGGIGMLYMTNAWDGIIYLTLTGILIVIRFLLPFKTNWIRKGIDQWKQIGLGTLASSGVVGSIFLLTSLPFSFHITPPVSGIGVLCVPGPIIQKVIELNTLPTLTNREKIIAETKMGKIGPFVLEKNHCQHTPLWQFGILYGHFAFFTIALILFLRKKGKEGSDIFIFTLAGFSTLLLIIPEFIYLRDIYPDHYRANTMFKLAFQAFMLLSLVSGYSFLRILSSTSKKTLWEILRRGIFLFVSIIIFILLFIYPYFAITSFYGNLNETTRQAKSLDGTVYLSTLYPNDVAGIRFLNNIVTEQKIILEAQGDSYTDYGRVSVHTGLPTVLGWYVHEWLWRGSSDVPAPRVNDIQRIYETTDIQEAKTLLNKYNVSYVFIGKLEKDKYPLLSEEKFTKLGVRIFQSGETTIYQLP